MWEYFLNLIAAVAGGTMGILGMWVTLYPSTAERAKEGVLIAFAFLTVTAVATIAAQGIMSHRAEQKREKRDAEAISLLRSFADSGPVVVTPAPAEVRVGTSGPTVKIGSGATATIFGPADVPLERQIDELVVELAQWFRTNNPRVEDSLDDYVAATKRALDDYGARFAPRVRGIIATSADRNARDPDLAARNDAPGNVPIVGDIVERLRHLNERLREEGDAP